MGSKIVRDFEIVDHGIEHEQYFQGCGVSHTPFEDIATGMGDNPAEAIDDALEQIAQNDVDVSDMEKRILADIKRRVMPKKPRVRMRDEEAHYYLSIRYNEGLDFPHISDDDLKLDHIPDVAECRKLQAKFKAGGFWPDVWHINERGNVDLLSVGYNGAKIVRSWV